jgi:nitroreductase
MKPDELMQLIKARRSVRKYTDEPVPEAHIEKMIEAALWAPSGSNSQNWQFIAVRSHVVKDKMLAVIKTKVDGFATGIGSARAHKEFLAYGNFYTFFAGAPVVIAVIKKPYISLNLRIMERYNIQSGAQPYSDVQGPAAAIENLLLMAQSMGYGTCWMTGPLIAQKELEELLSIEAPDRLMALIPVGRPAQTPEPTPRKNIREVYSVR